LPLRILVIRQNKFSNTTRYPERDEHTGLRLPLYGRIILTSGACANKHTITLHISHFVYYTSLHPSFFPTSLFSLSISFSLSPNFHPASPLFPYSLSAQIRAVSAHLHLSALHQLPATAGHCLWHLHFKISSTAEGVTRSKLP
jgi:hypothetical protein